MKTALKIEELFYFLISLYFFHLLDYSWWWFIGLFLIPDIAMAGYTIDSRRGAVIYNIFHHKAVAMALYAAGAFIQAQPLQLAGIILFAHSSLDRALGYGLKFPDSFQSTHLGTIGRKK